MELPSMPPTVPEEWKPLLLAHIRDRTGESRDTPNAGDFPADHDVVIRFPDGSHVRFRYAIAILDASLRTIGVFTEHCGYHFFPAADAEVDTSRPNLE